MEYSFYWQGYELKYSEKKKAFLDIEEIWNEVRKGYKMLFLSNFADFFNDYDDLRYKFKPVIEYLRSDCIEKHVRMLNDLRVYDVNEDIFLNNYEYGNYYIDIEEIVQGIFDPIDEIEQFIKEEDYMVEASKVDSGPFIGGGFGVSGAIKGMMMAGVANSIYKGAHNTFGGYSREINVKDFEKKRKELFESQDFHKCLCENLIYMLDTIHHEFLNILEEHYDNTLFERTDSNIENTQAMLDNLENGYITDLNEKKKILIKSFMFCPRLFKAYELAYDIYSDNGELLELAKFFHLEEKLDDYKLHILLNDLIKNGFFSRIKTINEIQDAEVKLHDMFIEMYIYDTESNLVLNYLHKETEEIEIASRTYEGKLHESISDVDVSRKELECTYDKMKVLVNTENVLSSDIIELINYKTYVEENFKSLFKKEITEMVQEVIDLYNEAVTNKINQKISFDNINSFEELDCIKKSIDSICNMYHVGKPILIQEKLNSVSDRVDKLSRTIGGLEYSTKEEYDMHKVKVKYIINYLKGKHIKNIDSFYITSKLAFDIHNIFKAERNYCLDFVSFCTRSLFGKNLVRLNTVEGILKLDNETVLAMVDTTLFDTAKTGIVFTNRNVYVPLDKKNLNKTMNVKIDDIQHLQIIKLDVISIHYLEEGEQKEISFYTNEKQESNFNRLFNALNYLVFRIQAEYIYRKESI